MVDMIVEELTIKAKAKGLTIIWHKPETPVIAEIDREKIEQVVMNLIDNAVHYTLTGTITIKIEEDKKHVIYSVQDTGIGIDRESMDNLFAKFYRAQDAIKVRPDGTGIGLYLCKIITEAHLGRIWVESKPGEGSKFSVELQKQARKQ